MSTKKQYKEEPYKHLYDIYLSAGFKIELHGSFQELGIGIDGEAASNDFGRREIQERCQRVAHLIKTELTEKKYRIGRIDKENITDPETFACMTMLPNKKYTFFDRPPYFDDEVGTYTSQLEMLKADLEEACQKHSLRAICAEPVVRLSAINRAAIPQARAGFFVK